MIDSLKLLMVKNKGFYNFLKKQLMISPCNMKLYELAFMHRSASIVLSDRSIVNNERLEFLGDAIIDAIIADYLFRIFPSNREGFLTQMRSKIVNRAHLDSIANRMGLIQAVVSYATNQETLKKRICGEVFEALIGAMYLDKGYKKTYKYITSHVIKNYIDLEQLTKTENDFKSRLIEWGQKHKLLIEFETIEENRSKPDLGTHFAVQVYISHVPIAKGDGKSKKEAEQMASQKTLSFIEAPTDFSPEALMKYLKRNKKQHQKVKNDLNFKHYGKTECF